MAKEYVIKEVAEILGITKDGVVKIAKKLDVGEKRVGMWWFTESELSLMKDNCRKYILAQRGN